MLAVAVLWLCTDALAGPDEGRSIYVAKCQACHGTTGMGDGPAARALPKPPRDFTDATFWGATSEASVRTVIRQGLPGTIMRGFPMPDAQMDDLVAYLRALANPIGPAAQPAPAPPAPSLAP